jgi:hypothetical protein
MSLAIGGSMTLASDSNTCSVSIADTQFIARIRFACVA